MTMKPNRAWRLRVEAAWNCLRGRPTVAFATFGTFEMTRENAGGLVVGNVIKGPHEIGPLSFRPMTKPYSND